MSIEPDAVERHYSTNPIERDLERIADAVETIAQCLVRVSSHQAIRIDKLL